MSHKRIILKFGSGILTRPDRVETDEDQVCRLVQAIAELKRRGHEDIAGIADLFEPDRARLRFEPMVAAQMLRGLTIVGNHPSLASEVRLSPAEIVSVLLDGVREGAC